MNEHDAGNDGPTGRPVPPTGEHHFAAAGYPPPHESIRDTAGNPCTTRKRCRAEAPA